MEKNRFNRFKKSKSLLAILMLLLIGAGGFYYGLQQLKGVPIGKNHLIRLHVVANSNSPVDQRVKLLVRDEIIKYMDPYFKDQQDHAGAKKETLRQLPNIKYQVEKCLASWGEGYGAQVMLGDFNFPTKTYGDLVLPSGKYEALKVVLGEGKGNNWWCVLYPPLCFLDISSTLTDLAVGELEELPDDYMVQSVSGKPLQVVVRFKIWDELQSLFDKRTLARHK